MGIKQLLSKFKNTSEIKPTELQAMDLETVSKLNVQEPQVIDLDTVSKLNELEAERAKENNLAYHLKMQQNNVNPACGYIEWDTIQMDFFTTVVIPDGYALTSQDDYSLVLTVDSHFIKFIQTQETKPATIYVENEQGEIENLDGLAKVNKTKISGSLVYNSFLSGFKAVNPLMDEKVAAFNQVGTIFIDRVLGYVCSECPEGENPLRDYSITLVPSQDVMVILPGSQVTVLEGAPEFFVLIGESRVKRIIGKQYTVIVSRS